MPVMDRVRHATMLPFPRSPLGAPSSAAEISRKIVAGQPYQADLRKR
jgi:hypothetical protein